MAERRKKNSTALRFLAGILLFGAVIAIALGLGEVRQFVHILAGIRWPWIALAALAQFCTYACLAATWREVLMYSDHRLRLGSLISLTIAQLFARQTVPTGGISGAMMAVRGLQNRGVSAADSLGCMMVNLIAFYAAFLIAVILTLALLAVHHDLSAASFLAGALFVLIALGIPSFTMWTYRRVKKGELPGWLRRRAFMRRLEVMLPNVPVAPLKSRRLLFRATLWQFGVFAFDALTLAVILVSIGFPIAFGKVFTSHVMASTAAAIGLIPLGLGTYEATGIAMLHLWGLPVEAALAAILVLRGFTFWLPMLPGFFLARRELQLRHPSHHGDKRAASPAP